MKLHDWQADTGTILPMQHHGYTRKGWKVHTRSMLLGVRIVDRLDDDDEQGQWVMEDETHGDLGGGFFWKRAGRAISTWRWSWPAILEPGYSLPSGGGYTGPAGETTPGLREPSDAPPAPPSVTPISAAEAGARFIPNWGNSYDAASGNWVLGVSAQDFMLAAAMANQVNAAGGLNAFMVGAGAGGGGGGGAAGAAGGGGAGAGAGQGFVPLMGGAGFQFNPAWGNVPAFVGKNAAGQVVFAGGNLFGIGVQPFKVNPNFGNAGLGGVLGAAGAKSPAFGIGVAALNIWTVSKQGGGGPGAFIPGGHYSNPDVDPTKGSTQKGAQGALGGLGIAGPGGAGTGSTGALMRPLRHSSWVPDSGYQRILPSVNENWPTLGRGVVGIAIAATNEDEQVEYFMPTDPRLVAAHLGDPAIGSIVCDVQGDQLSDTYRARLQSMMRVIKAPTGKWGWLKKNKEWRLNSLAWTLGLSGQEDGHGGMVVDVASEGRGLVIGLASAHDGGPFDVGGVRDGHSHGKDDDGNTINALHLSHKALIRRSFMHDGPRKYDGIWPACGDLDFPVDVHHGWDASTGMWRSWTTATQYTVPGHPVTTTPPDHDPRTPTTRTSPWQAPDGSTARDWKDAYDLATTQRQVFRPATSSSPRGPKTGIANLTEVMFPSVSFRASLVRKGAPDVRYNRSAPLDQVQAYDWTAPVVGRIECYGAQGGPAGGPYLGAPGGGTRYPSKGAFNYTQKPVRGRHFGGTAPGGLVLLPPEVDMDSIDQGFAPGSLPVSPTYFTAAPGTRWGAGSPELAQGSIKDGMSWGIEAGDLVFRSHNAEGDLGGTPALTVTPTGVAGLIDPAHAELSVAGGSSTQPAPLTPTQFGGFTTAGPTHSMTADVIGGGLVCAITGTYELHAQVSLEALDPANTYWMELYINGAPTGLRAVESVQAMGEVRCHSCLGNRVLAATDTVAVFVWSATPTGSYLASDAQLMAKQIR